MATLDGFVYCMRTEQNKDGTTSAIDIRYALVLDFLPTAFTFGIVACINGLDGITNHAFRYRLIDGDDAEVYDTQDIEIPYIQIKKDNPRPHAVPANDDGITISMMFNNVILKKQGRYKTEIYVDGQQIGVRTIFIVEKS